LLRLCAKLPMRRPTARVCCWHLSEVVVSMRDVPVEGRPEAVSGGRTDAIDPPQTSHLGASVKSGPTAPRNTASASDSVDGSRYFRNADISFIKHSHCWECSFFNFQSLSKMPSLFFSGLSRMSGVGSLRHDIIEQLLIGQPHARHRSRFVSGPGPTVWTFCQRYILAMQLIAA
jgi:hypothetical protein